MADWWRDEETAGELIARARDRQGKSQYALAEALREVSGRSDGVPTWPPSYSSRPQNYTGQLPSQEPAGSAIQKRWKACRPLTDCATFLRIQAVLT
jgi:hypothetical protein